MHNLAKNGAFQVSKSSETDFPLHCTTVEAARRLGLAVRSVQLMVDRGELEGWRTTGGHRRIWLDSVQRWILERRPADGRTEPRPSAGDAVQVAAGASHVDGRTKPATVLIIEDSMHYQKLLSLLMEQHFPEVKVHLANDGVSGLAMCGSIEPDLLVVDLLLPGIDGAALIAGVRSHEQFAAMQLIVVTSLDERQREPYSFTLAGVPVVHKSRIVHDLPALLAQSLSTPRQRIA